MELWQGYTEQGEPILDAGLTLGQAAAGALHGAAHVWMWRGAGNDIEILLQQRTEHDRTWPSYLDVSVAGHVDFGETPLQTAIRETEEEIGVTLQPENISLLFVHRRRLQPNPDIIENELLCVYGHRLSKIVELVLQRSEVALVIWQTPAELQEAIADKRVVPHGDTYYTKLFEQIRKRSGSEL